MPYDVFISYSHIDKAVADAVVNHLENDNIRCWYAPRDIATGREWAEAIMDAIHQTKIMVLIFTDDSNESIQVRREVDSAINYGLTIIPFKLTVAMPSGAMEYYLSTLHWLDALDTPLEEAILELDGRVRAILDGPQDISSAGKTTQKKKKGTLRLGTRLGVGIPCTLIVLPGLFLFFYCIFSVQELLAVPLDGLITLLLALSLITGGLPGVLMMIRGKALKTWQYILCYGFSSLMMAWMFILAA